MLNPYVGGISLAAAVALVVAFGGSDANAQKHNPFDGAWSVNIQVTRGECNGNVLYGVVITNGSVRYAGGANVAVAGNVDAEGRRQRARGQWWAVGIRYRAAVAERLRRRKLVRRRRERPLFGALERPAFGLNGRRNPLLRRVFGLPPPT